MSIASNVSSVLTALSTAGVNSAGIISGCGGLSNGVMG